MLHINQGRFLRSISSCQLLRAPQAMTIKTSQQTYTTSGIGDTGATPSIPTTTVEFNELFSDIRKENDRSEEDVIQGMLHKPLCKDSPIKLTLEKKFAKPTSEDLYERAVIEVRGIAPGVSDSYMEFLRRTAVAFGISVRGPIRLRTNKVLKQVLRSPFVHKKSMELFAKITYMRTITIGNCSDANMDLFLRYAEDNLPADMELHLTETHYVAMPDNVTQAIATAIKEHKDNDNNATAVK